MKVPEGLKTAADRIGLVTTLVVATAVAGALSPLVSVVALPIFAVKAIPKWIEHRSFYNKTLTDGSREKYGRVSGQDYTRWDGKKVVQVEVDAKAARRARMHEAIDKHIHGKEYFFYNHVNERAVDSPFQTQEDLDWLNKEYTRKEKKDLLDTDLKMLRAFAKAIIPFIGVWWVLGSEFKPGGASEFGCRVCSMGGNEDAHWGSYQAISYHKKVLTQKLAAVGAASI
jgi:hypothetical protein